MLWVLNFGSSEILNIVDRPRRLQDGPKTTQNRPNITQNAPRPPPGRPWRSSVTEAFTIASRSPPIGIPLENNSTPLGNHRTNLEKT